MNYIKYLQHCNTMLSSKSDLTFHLLQDMRLDVSGFEDFIFSLNNQNFLLKKGARVYQLQTSSFL